MSDFNCNMIDIKPKTTFKIAKLKEEQGIKLNGSFHVQQGVKKKLQTCKRCLLSPNQVMFCPQSTSKEPNQSFQFIKSEMSVKELTSGLRCLFVVHILQNNLRPQKKKKKLTSPIYAEDKTNLP